MKYTKNKEVQVKVCSFIDLFTKEAAYPISIDTYQRPYIWDIDKVNILIEDLKEYLKDTEDLSYYMGSILLHQHDEKKQLFIIDGQQRLTTLSILYFVLYGKLTDKMAMEYHSPLSAKNIKNTQVCFKKIKDEWEGDDNFFSKIVFTCIVTIEEDMAFTFFDTQNNRGVKLSPTDLLKAYHLRAIGNSEHSDIQVNCASRWEKIQTYPTLFGRNKDFAAQLFHQFLWRSRVWRGQRVIYHENDSHILTEFQNNTLKSNCADTVPLYPNSNNALGKKLQIKVSQGYVIQPVDIKSSNNSANLPFTLRQPITEGLGFFLFSEKYADLVRLLLFDKTIHDNEIISFRKLYKNVWEHISIYLKELFILSAIMYYDKFGNEKLLEFSLWLDHVLGAIRLEKQYIFKEAPLKFLKEARLNLLDVISQAFTASEVIDFLKNLKIVGNDEKLLIAKIYNKTDITDTGVIGNYKKKVLNFYQQENFSQKESWINQNFINKKLEEK